MNGLRLISAIHRNVSRQLLILDMVLFQIFVFIQLNGALWNEYDSRIIFYEEKKKNLYI